MLMAGHLPSSSYFDAFLEGSSISQRKVRPALWSFFFFPFSSPSVFSAVGEEEVLDIVQIAVPGGRCLSVRW